MLRKILAAAAAVSAALFISINANAAEGDLVVVLNSEPAAMLVEDNPNIINHEGRVFVVSSYMDALSLAPASEIACIFEDSTAQLFDNEIDSSPVNDPQYSNQWGLDVIKAPYAWAIGANGSGVKVGIVDSGMRRPSHEDLNIPSQFYNVLSGSDYTDYADIYSHGTKVAGIIGAKTNNGIGIAGIAGGSELVPIKVTDEKNLYTSDMIIGFEKAVDYNCSVINLSLGFSESKTSLSTIRSINSRIQNAINKGIIIVAAAGNDGSKEYQYPASYDNVVSVSSIGTSSSLTAPSSFSQHNDKVTIAAPGFNILSTTNTGGYISSSGTSFAAPMVSAAAAIAKQINPNITASEFIDVLKKTAVDIYTEGYDEYTGYGLLDLKAMTEYLLSENPLPTPSPEPSATPDATALPIETATPAPSKSSFTKDDDLYTITAVHEPISSHTRVIAALYENDRLTAVRFLYGVDGNTVNKFTYRSDKDITKAEIYAWDFTDPSKPIPVIDKQTLELE
mgnify:CR=1 FL=1